MAIDWQNTYYRNVPRRPNARTTDVGVCERFAEQWTDSTLRKYVQQLKDIEKFFACSALVSEISFKDAESFRMWLKRERGLSDSVVNHTIEFSKSVFSYGEKLGYCKVNPFSLVKALKERPVRSADPFTPAEVQKLISTAKERMPWFYPFVLVGAITGARRSELCNLLVADVDGEQGRLTIQARKNSAVPYAFQLPAEIMEVLTALTIGRNPESPLFVNRVGRPYSTHSLDVKFHPPTQHAGVWRQLLDYAGVRPRGLHNLRSGVVTNLVDAGFSLDQTTAVVANTPEVARRHYLVTKRLNQSKQIATLVKIYAINRDLGAVSVD